MQAALLAVPCAKACSNEDCHARQFAPSHRGHYDEIHTCPSCNTSACWSCMYAQCETPALLCLECGQSVCDANAPEHDASARVHSFAHDVITGDFSQDPETPGAFVRVIARYVLRNQLYVAANYTRRGPGVSSADVVAAAEAYLDEYGFAPNGVTMYHNAVRTYTAWMAA